MRTHEQYFLGALGCLFLGVVCQCVVLWFQCDPAGQFGPKGDGTAVVRDLFGPGVTPGLVALRVQQGFNVLILITLALTLGVIGTLEVVEVLNARVLPSNPFEEDKDDEDEPEPEPQPRPRAHRPRVG